VSDAEPSQRPLSQREYAKRRGVSHVAVQRAINSGRLNRSVRDGKVVDPELADREWEASTDLSKAPGSVVERAAERAAASGGAARPRVEPVAPVAVLGASLAENNAAKAYWQAKQAELDFREAAKELVPADEVRGALTETFRSCRTKLLGLPARIRQQIPHLTPADVGTIESLVREALEDLAAQSAP